MSYHSARGIAVVESTGVAGEAYAHVSLRRPGTAHAHLAALRTVLRSISLDG